MYYVIEKVHFDDMSFANCPGKGYTILLKNLSPTSVVLLVSRQNAPRTFIKGLLLTALQGGQGATGVKRMPGAPEATSSPAGPVSPHGLTRTGRPRGCCKSRHVLALKRMSWAPKCQLSEE